MDVVKIAAEHAWLTAHPDFEERPATLREFLGPDYLNLGGTVRKRIEEELSNIMGDTVSAERMTMYPLAMITGGIGIGKTTVAAIVLTYMVHWCLCLKNPQAFFGLMPGSRIAFMEMSTSEKQALEVIFGDIKARVKHSPWFLKWPYDTSFKNKFVFPKDIWIVPGDSAETTFEGYNILGGVIDEADSHKVTEKKDYAEEGFNTIYNRISSRFQDRGFLLVIGQMKKATGFAARKFNELQGNPEAYAVRLAIWDSMGDEFYADPITGEVQKFAYDTNRKRVIPDAMASALTNANIIWIPSVYRNRFDNDPEKALRDLAGIPPLVGSPFISLVHKIYSCRDRWVERYPTVAEGPVRADGTIERWLVAPDHLKRAIHVDIAYAGGGDALGLAMAHVPEIVEIDGERKPYIVFDLLLRLKVPEGQEIFLGDMRRIIYNLRDERGFKIVDVTLDGFESQDTIQQLRKRRYRADYLSVDRQKLPYEDLREAIYEERVDFPPFLVTYNFGDNQLTEVAIKELSELIEGDRKIDHPERGSKDVADAMAGCVYTLMGDRTYARNVVSINTRRRRDEDMALYGAHMNHPAVVNGSYPAAPIPPTLEESIRRFQR